jgi:hypothetical protein
VAEIDDAGEQWDDGNNCDGLQQALGHVRVLDL